MGREKGYKHSGKTKEKLKEAKKGKNHPFYGKHLSEKHKRKISKANGGKNSSGWKGGKPKCIICGKKLSDYRTKICRDCFKKENSPNWQGGKSFEPYGIEFNEDLKEVVRNRDRRKCFMCEVTELENEERLSVHHIDYDKRNNKLDNLISLCRHCHLRTNYNRKKWINYFKLTKKYE